jgi:hypothetical protein
MLTLDPEVKEADALYKLPIHRAHNMAARERISKVITLETNPRYKEFLKWR